jgi:hypothetical protein
MLSGFMITHAIHQYIVTMVAWFPLVLLLLRKALTGGWHWVFAGALVLGHSILAGFPQLTLYLYFFLLSFFLFELLTTFKPSRVLSAPALIASSKAAVLVVLSVAIAMIQLLPTLEFADLTFRAQITYQKATEGQFSWEQLLTFLYPKFFGSAGAAGYNYHGPGTYWYFWETCMYLGILPFLLMIMSWTIRASSKYVGFFLGFAVFAVLFALGDNFVLHRVFFDHVPGFDTFRNPARMGIFVAFGAALLAAFTLHHVLHEQPSPATTRTMRKHIAVIVGVGVLIYLLLISGSLSFAFVKNPAAYSTIKKEALVSLLVLAASGILLFVALQARSNRIWWAIGAGVLFFADMSAFGGSQNSSRTNPLEYFRQTSRMVEFLKEDSKTEVFRVNMRNQQGMLMDRNQGLMDRIQLMEGYTPLVLQRYLPPARDWSQLCDMMNAKYRIATDTIQQSLTLTRATTYLPRAYMVYDARIIADSAELFTFMQGPLFEPSRMVVLDETPASVAADTSSTREWSARIEEYKLNSLRVHVSTPRDGFLVFAEIYYPGWSVYIDAQQHRIFRANWNQRAVFIPRGTHLVEMRYEPVSFRTGMWITLAAVAVCIGGVVVPLQRRKPHEDSRE